MHWAFPAHVIPCLLGLEECFHLALKPKTIVTYGSIKQYESDCVELDLFKFILYTLAANIKKQIQMRGTGCVFVFQMTLLIASTYETGKTIGDNSDYWVNNACLRIWPWLYLLLVLHFVEWFIYSMSVNPVPSVGDVIFLMYYTCCTPGKKAATWFNISLFLLPLSTNTSYTYLFQMSLKQLLKNIHLQKKRKKLQVPVHFLYYWHFRYQVNYSVCVIHLSLVCKVFP